MPSRISPSASSRDSGFMARGRVAWKPAVIAGVTIMKMMSRTSITSIIGVTLMSALTAALELAPPIAMGQLSFDRAAGLRRLLRLELLRKDRPPEFAADALDEIIDQLFRRVRHFHRQEVDLGAEVVVEPHRRNRDEQTERGGDQRFGDAARDRGQ